MSQSYRFVVSGRVQGVFFRQSTRQVADQLGLVGWVRNRPDGCVEGMVSGSDPDRISQFRLWLKRGPASATVNELQWQAAQTPEESFTDFEVRH